MSGTSSRPPTASVPIPGPVSLSGLSMDDRHRFPAPRRRGLSSSGDPGPSSSLGSRGITPSSSVPYAPPSRSSSSFYAQGIGRSPSSSYQPRITRVNTMDLQAAHPTLSPTRTRRASAHIPRTVTSIARPPVATPATTTSTSAQDEFSMPEYLKNSVLWDRLRPFPTDSNAPDTSLSGMTSPRLASPQSRTSESDDESIRGSSRRPQTHHASSRTAPPSPPPSLDSTLLLPTRWNEHDKNKHIIISKNGKVLTFSGQTSTSDRDASAAAVRAECAIPSGCGVYYYEVEILNRGHKGQISIGFAVKNFQLSRLPGWENGSWGYHGDDGLCFAGQTRLGMKFGPRFGAGDVIGCGIDFVNRNAFYTKDGHLIGSIFKDLPETKLYPAVGLRSNNESVFTNFGQKKFMFDIATYVADLRLKTWKSIQATYVQAGLREDNIYSIRVTDPPPSVLAVEGIQRSEAEQLVARSLHENLRAPMADIILDYLAFQGYSKTTSAFKTSLSKHASHNTASTSMDLDHHVGDDLSDADIAHRQQIMNKILEGDINNAIQLLQEHYPNALNHDNGLLRFRLKCRAFTELILQSAEKLKEISNSMEDSGSGAVAVDSANSMDLDEDDFPVPPSPSTVTRNGFGPAVNGGITTGISNLSALKGKARPTRRRASSVSRSPVRMRRPSGNSQLLTGPFPDSARGQSADIITTVLEAGQELSQSYASDSRTVVTHFLKKTLGLIAYVDPESHPVSKELVGPGVREVLADEVNKAILDVFNRPVMPTLERLYRQTYASIHALGVLGVGKAAFADTEKELLSDQ